jgi:hypothetical protein
MDCLTRLSKLIQTVQGLQELLSDRSVSNRLETNQLTRTYIYKTIHMMGQETSKVTYDSLFSKQMVR